MSVSALEASQLAQSVYSEDGALPQNLIDIGWQELITARFDEAGRLIYALSGKISTRALLFS
jgi:hypothetical protein